MGSRFFSLILVLELLFGASFLGRCFATTYYVGPGGSDSNSGLAYGNPFGTFGKAIGLANSGDTIYALGGTYNLNSKLSISKSGLTGNRINLWAYPGETPILDFSGQSDSDSNRGIELSSSADWWHIKGLTIQNAGDNGFNTNGDNGIFEQLVTRFNRDSGFQLGSSASNNLVLNCDSYRNYDPPKRGEDADGFAVKSSSIGAGNIFMGDRAWENSDDGWDMFGSRANGMLILNSWSFDNGYDPGGSGTFNGDGNGIKLGHDSGSHILANVLAVSNPVHGIDVNGNGYEYDQFGNPTVPNGNHVEIYNSTSFKNGGKNWLFDESIAHILRNNISLSGSSSNTFNSGVVHDHNTWNGAAFAVSADDFESIDLGDGAAQQIAQILRGDRQADGSLPDIGGFLHLINGSNLIDTGTPISFTFAGVNYNLVYNGDAPDLGAFETSAAVPILPGDYNNDGKVSAADYTVWRDNLGANGTLDNEDASPGVVDEDDYDVWLDHYGESNLGSGAGSAASLAAVPEPSALLLAAIVAGLLCVRRRVF